VVRSMNPATAAADRSRRSALTDASAPPRMDRTNHRSMTLFPALAQGRQSPSKSKTNVGGGASRGSSTITSISVAGGAGGARAGISAKFGCRRRRCRRPPSSLGPVQPCRCSQFADRQRDAAMLATYAATAGVPPQASTALMAATHGVGPPDRVHSPLMSTPAPRRRRPIGPRLGRVRPG